MEETTATQTDPAGYRITVAVFTESYNQVGWKRPLRLSSPTVTQRLPSPPPNHVTKGLIYMNTLRDGDFITSLGSLFQCPATLSVKKCFLSCLTLFNTTTSIAANVGMSSWHELSVPSVSSLVHTDLPNYPTSAATELVVTFRQNWTIGKIENMPLI